MAKYKDIASDIRDKIITGDWFYGMKIPSHRQLAIQYNVNRVTIIKSIELLEAEGFIYTKVGSGTYVNDYLNEAHITNKWSEMMLWSSQQRSQYTVQLINKIETDDSYIHISKGELGISLMPHIQLKKAMSNTASHIEDLSFGYNNGYGYIKLRDIIVERMSKQGINVGRENVMITSGALHAIQLLSIGFLGQDAIIISNTPSYIHSTNVFEQLNFRHIDVPYNRINEIDTIIDRFINFKNKAIYIEPRFNNPTGRSLTNEQKKNIITYSERHNIPIIEDDIFRDIFFSDPTPSIKTYDKLGKVIHISSFSKTIAPAIRIGWIVASEKIIEQLADVRMQIDYGSSILSQMVVYEMLKNKSYDKHLVKLRYVLKDKRDFMLNILNNLFKDIAHWEVPSGGYFVWLVFKIDIDIKYLFYELLSKEKILINPGYIYGSKEKSIRLSFAFESNENIKHALYKIYTYVKKV
ncbi:TPA: PLP-dependent aminotransferase family protein [Staphylococcus aureus]|nr:PLP-dependent aminotransferase family protein [Staphylococcus aureus]